MRARAELEYTSIASLVAEVPDCRYVRSQFSVPGAVDPHSGSVAAPGALADRLTILYR
jgi:hypothetical protein